MTALLPLVAVALAHPPVAHELRRDELAQAFVDVAPRRLSLAEAYVHAEAALEAERIVGVDAVVLGGVACVESHFTAGVQSGRGKMKGKGKYCGALQATRDRDGWSCVELKTARIGYRAGALSLQRWLDARGGSLARALAGYGGVSVNGSTSYPRRVLRCAARIRARIEGSGTAPRTGRKAVPLAMWAPASAPAVHGLPAGAGAERSGWA